MATKEQFISRPLGGFDRSRRSHVSVRGHYDLLNLRPVRGQLVQTPLIAPWVDELNFIIVIVPDQVEFDWNDWVEFESPVFGDPVALDMADWSGFADPTYGDAVPLDMPEWVEAFVSPEYGAGVPLDMDLWVDGGL